MSELGNSGKNTPRKAQNGSPERPKWKWKPEKRDFTLGYGTPPLLLGSPLRHATAGHETDLAGLIAADDRVRARDCRPTDDRSADPSVQSGVADRVVQDGRADPRVLA